MRRTLLLLAAGMLAFGCDSPNKSFEVAAKNHTSDSVTLFLTKDGPPAEEGWYSPEEIVKMTGAPPRYDLAFVPPGKTGFTEKLGGTFPKGTHAVLRVYPGEKEVYDLAKTPPEQRTDFILKPGSNNLTIEEQAGKLVVK